MDHKTVARFASEGTYVPDRLIADHADDLLAKGITLLAGQNLERGTVLGRITASGKYVRSLSAAADGSQVPTAILAEDTDASAGDRGTNGYFAGTFNSAALILGTGHTLAGVTDTLRGVGIYLVTVQAGV